MHIPDIRFRISALALAIAGLAASGAGAQTVPAAPAAPAPATAAEPQAGNAIADIVVTARRRQESLQNVPIAVTALTSAVLQTHNITVAQDVQYITPSLSVQGGNYNRLGADYAIRGAPAQGTIVYRDEIPGLYLPSLNGSPSVPYYDLASIQVLKGPQGTLFGGTSTGGAVLISSAKPTNDFGGYVQGSYGNLNTRYFEGAINLPILADKVLLRIAGDVRRRDGYTLNLFDGQHLDNQNTNSVRATLTLKPFDGFENTTIYEYNYRKERVGNSSPLSCNPNGSLNGGAGTGPGTWYAQCLANTTLGARRVNQDLTGLGKLKENFVSNVTTLNLTDDLLIKNIFGYVLDATGNRNDSDGVNFVPPSTVGLSETINPYPQYLINRSQQYTDELQIQGKSLDNKLNWIVGGFFEAERDPKYNHLLASVGLPFLFDVVSRGRTTEKAVFAQGTYDANSLIRGVSLTAGIRSTWDKNKTISAQNVCHFPASSPNALQCVSFEDAADLFNPAFTDYSPTAGAVTTRAESNAVTYDVTLNYKPVRGVMLYVTKSRGYRPGGVQAFAPTGFEAYLPEKVDNWEVGVKSEFNVAGAAARLNIAAYTDDYRNLQRTATIGPATALTVNAAKARLQGVEVDGTLVLSKWLTIDATYAYLDDKFKRFVIDFPGFGNVDESSAPFPLAPKNTFSVTGTITVPTPENVGRLTLTANYSYRGSTYLAQDTYYQPDLRSRSYGLVNLEARWSSVLGTSFDVSAFAQNLTNKTYIDGSGNYTYNFNPLQSSGIDTVFYGEPRTYGVTLRYNFGDHR